MIVEERTYHVHTGHIQDVVDLYANEGTVIQQRILGHLVAAFTVDIGDLSSIVQLWAYESDDERRTRRSSLQRDEAWQSFLAKLTPLIHTQTSRLLIPTSYSPLR